MSKRKRTTHREPAHDGRWPIIALVDERPLQLQRDTPFGQAKWTPRGGEESDNARIAAAIIETRDRERDMARRDGRQWRGLNSRQYGYRLKTRKFKFLSGEKLDKQHFRTIERIVARMRRCGILDWGDVVDKRGTFHEPLEFEDNCERAATLPLWAARDMPHVRLEEQPIIPELVVETLGLYDLIYDIANKYGARTNGLEGQSIIGMRRKLADRVARRWRQDNAHTRVLCVADLDKAGDVILRTVAADTAQHLRDMGLPVDKEQILQFRRVALTQRQCDDHEITLVESEDGRLVQEAEALPTEILRPELEAAFEDTLDMDLFARVAKKKQPEIDEFARKIRKYCESFFDDA